MSVDSTFFSSLQLKVLKENFAKLLIKIAAIFFKYNYGSTIRHLNNPVATTNNDIESMSHEHEHEHPIDSVSQFKLTKAIG